MSNNKGDKPFRVRPNKELAKQKRGVFASGASGCGGGSAEPLDKRGAVDFICSTCEPPRVFKQKERLLQHVARHHPEAPPPAGAAAASSSASAPAATPAAPVRVTTKTPRQLLSEYLQKASKPAARYSAREAAGAPGWACKLVLPDKHKPDEDVVLFCDEPFPSKDEACEAAALVALARVASSLPLHRLLSPQFKERFAAEEGKERERAARAAARAEDAARRKAHADRPKEKLQPVYMSEEKRRMVEAALAALREEAAASSPALAEPRDDDGGGGGDDGDGGSDDAGDAAYEPPQWLVTKLVGLGFAPSDVEECVRSPARPRTTAAALDWLVLRVPDARLPRRFGAGAGEPVGVGRLFVKRAEDAAPPAPPPPPMRADAAAAARVNGHAAREWSRFRRAGYTRAEAAAAAAAAAASSPTASPSAAPSPAALLSSGHESVLLELFGSLLRAEAGGGAAFFPAWPRAGAPAGHALPAPLATADDGDAEAWEDELTALEAIFGECCCAVSPARKSVTLTLPLPCDDDDADADAAAAAPREGEQTVRLRVSLPEGSAYPRVPPLIELSLHAAGASTGDERSLLRGVSRRRAARALTVHLATAAAASASSGAGPCVYALATDGLAGAAAVIQAASPSAGGGDDSDGDSVEGAAADGGGGDDAPKPDVPNGTARLHPAPRGTTAQVLAPPRSQPPPHPQRPRRPVAEPSAADAARSAAALSAALDAYDRAAPGSAAHAMRLSRGRLPAAESRAEVLTAIATHSVVVLSGETGCGKSTQVPQFLLEQAARDGTPVNIVVTQPRRIAAVGLAERVAAERCEPLGGVVGYAVRQDVKRSASTRLLFCTTGVLLRRLLDDPQLAAVTHVILDEVHERALESDLLLLLLRDVASARPTLKLILMSATADARLFVSYFSGQFALSPKPQGAAAKSDAKPRPAGVGQVFIPGFTHPVAELFLEDVLERTGYRVGKGSRYARKKAPSSGFTPGLVDRETGEAVGAAERDEQEEDAAAEEEEEEEDAEAALRAAVAADGGDDDATAAAASEPPAPPAALAAAGVPDDWDAAGAASPRPPPPPSAARPAGDTSEWALDRASSAASNRVASSANGAAASSVDAAKRTREDAEASAARSLSGYSETTRRSLSHIDEAAFNPELIEQLVAYIVEEEAERGPGALMPQAAPLRAAPKHAGAPNSLGAILVFLPGAAEVDKCCRALQRSRRLSGTQLWVLPLHGALPPADQARVFARPPPGARKIVCATNLAETSVTIDDVTVVIDTGRAKEMRFDPARGLSSLAEHWASAASGRQRRGRAGRVRPGVVLRLFSRSTSAALPPHGVPEMLRVPLDSLVLRLKALAPASPAAPTLARALSPPPTAAVAAAISSLRSIGAIAACPPSSASAFPSSACDNDSLTPLGAAIARLPLDPRLAKLLIYASMLGCLDPMLSVAGALAAGKPLFLSPRDGAARAEADAARARLASGAGRSDHLAAARAYDAWAAAGRAGRGGSGGGGGSGRGGRSPAVHSTPEQRAFAAEHHLSQTGLESVRAARADCAAALAELGFASRAYAERVARCDPPSPSTEPLDAHAASARVARAALTAGLYPRVVRVRSPAQLFAPTIGGAVAVDGPSKALRFFTKDGSRVWMHPASLNAAAGAFDSPWLVFSEVVATSRPFVRDTTCVAPYALLLFGGDVAARHEAGTLAVDGWIDFAAPSRVAVLVRELRSGLDRLLASKVANPATDVTSSPAVKAVLNLLLSDGM